VRENPGSVPRNPVGAIAGSARGNLEAKSAERGTGPKVRTMTRLRGHRRVSNWRESCMIFARRGDIMPTLTIRHVTTYRYRRPVAFGEHRMMLRPRDSHDQKVIEASVEISPEPKSLRFVQDAFGNT
jgi:hypothetical protein